MSETLLDQLKHEVKIFEMVMKTDSCGNWGELKTFMLRLNNIIKQHDSIDSDRKRTEK